MELYLYQNGFSPSENKSTWVKGSWTVRIFSEEIEIYDDLAEYSSAKYIMINKDLEKLKDVLQDAGLV